ncbi:hypothetical protein [uncultured Alistipes sp.]|uniref:hypothetical protein n=1 Tax=uncultured Alistipes sp. TaxID=538949 RepID=UPI0026658387|nr:hypothetical protein [uncultured Alistipes sp.]
MKNLFSKFVQWLTTIATDKYQHFAVGAALGAVALVAMKLLWLLMRQIEVLSQVSPAVERWTTLTASVIVVYAAAIIKERKVDAQSDVTDIVATVLGGSTVWVVFLIG